MGKISPAPWYYCRETGEVIDSRGLRIATPNDPTEQVESDDLEVIISEEDGVLMAATPELVEALLKLMSATAPWFPSDHATRYFFRDAGKRAMAALAKAGIPIEESKAATSGRM